MITPNWRAPQNVQAFTLLPGETVPLPGEVSALKQVHGIEAVILPQQGQLIADAAITRTPNTVCRVQTADCLPLLVTHSEGNEVAAIHAGWRGLAAGVIESTFAKMTSPRGSCLVWLGPAISRQAFEVGQEVYDAFMEWEKIHPHSMAGEGEIQNAFTPSQNEGRYMADLYALARIRLIRLGVKPENITGGEYCTYSDTRFASYRRSKGTAARQYNLIWFRS